MKGDRPNCSGCRIQAKQMNIIWTLQGVKFVELPGTKREIILKKKLISLKENSKIKDTPDLHRSKNEYKKGYQCRTDIVKDENGDLLADFCSILNRWKNFFG
jgi:hypothetical protein